MSSVREREGININEEKKLWSSVKQMKKMPNRTVQDSEESGTLAHKNKSSHFYSMNYFLSPSSLRKQVA